MLDFINYVLCCSCYLIGIKIDVANGFRLNFRVSLKRFTEIWDREIDEKDEKHGKNKN